MASIKVKFRPSTVADHEGTIYYQIIHQRKVRQLYSSYHIFESEWDETGSTIIVSITSERCPLILTIRAGIYHDIQRLAKIDHKLASSGLDYSVDDILDEFTRYIKEYSLFHFMDGIISRLRLNGKIRTAETYQSTLNSFRKYRADKDIVLDCITSEIMEGYEAWQKERGVVPNTISFYTRILRAVYNRAVEEEIIENRYPFRHVYTGIDKTLKRALPLPVIKKIKSLDLSPQPNLEYARDMFLMSFYLRGMSFIDMAFLKKSNLHNGYITYRRRKTGQLLIIKWTAEMQKLLDKYPANNTDYLLPIIRKAGTNERYTYLYQGSSINHNLKRIAEMTGIPIPLTLYVARHSWASAARTKGIPVSIISEGMGHGSESTTRIYLASLDTSAIDKANSLILNSL